MKSIKTILLFALMVSFGVACSDSGTGSENDEPETLRKATYTLNANSNSGTLSDGVLASATFWELSETQTVVTLTIDAPTGANVVHPSHIHFNAAEDGGGIAYFLTPIDGTDPDVTSARVINESFDTLVNFDGYINIHESVENIGNVVSQGNIGSNANVAIEDGLAPLEEGRTESYTLGANANSGSVAPNGISAGATFTEVTDGLTLVTLDLNTQGATGADKPHPAHIHENAASEGGAIAYYLGAIDPMDPDSRSSMLISESFDDLMSYDGYINIHESLSNLGAVVSQGNIGANAGDTSGNGSTGY